ncbi:hypothetical protein NH286_03450 [Anaerococcus sp. NML200574]|uniref:hypothetical protein n=1 Tax=Anaerococcus sp. NML200574 TaxID=2954486 RepID=UPI002237A8C2|nr:hypothetical protein [Anaerococcus sp. NML200574]MCW6678207.1 hypothetical protein [Anaerococcus sp. NML200574]
MKIYLINGENNIGKTDFAVNLSERLAQNEKVLLTSFFRDEKQNLEDFFGKDGMISYDIADYFLGFAGLDRVIVNENSNLGFIIPPLLEDKYDFKVEDVYTLIDILDSDIVIIDNLDLDIKGAVKIDIISEKDIDKDLNSNYFFINKAPQDFDIRKYKDKIDNKNSKFLGVVKENEFFKTVIDNLIADKEEEIPSLGFFEKLKMIFAK